MWQMAPRLSVCLQAPAAAACAINDDNMLRHTLRVFLCNLVLGIKKKKMFGVITG